MTTITERDETAKDIFTTAIEGGVNYWLGVDQYKWVDLDLDYFATGTLVEENTPVRIDRNVIRKGIRVAYEKRSEIGNLYVRRAICDLQWGNYDDLDYDADVADIVVQMGLFGEIVYA